MTRISKRFCSQGHERVEWFGKRDDPCWFCGAEQKEEWTDEEACEQAMFYFFGANPDMLDMDI